jgi:hypothetical protein
MAKGLSLAIGLNSVDPKHYGGWSGELNACEADATEMAALAQSQGFRPTALLTKNATRKRVQAELKKAALALKSGDIFMLSYSGHGGQLPDLNDDEPDAQDETWCLFDGEQVDDELYSLLFRFAAGVRVLVFSDSCHSGSAVRMAYYHGTMATRTGAGAPEVRYRAMPRDVALRTYRLNKAFYDPILANPKLKEAPKEAAASILLISGCQDNQLSQDGAFNGLFTGQLLQVWKNGMFEGSYRDFHKAIVERMPPDQTPNYFRAGRTSTAFEKQRAFSI